MPKRDQGFCETDVLSALSVPQRTNRQNDQQLDQCDAADEARSRASRTQARIRSPKSAMNA